MAQRFKWKYLSKHYTKSTPEQDVFCWAYGGKTNDTDFEDFYAWIIKRGDKGLIITDCTTGEEVFNRVEAGTVIVKR